MRKGQKDEMTSRGGRFRSQSKRVIFWTVTGGRDWTSGIRLFSFSCTRNVLSRRDSLTEPVHKDIEGCSWNLED